ncbi:DUF3846 domain-containing protein [Spirosoma aerophilum]
MKAFLIDPTSQTITEVEQNGLEDLYKLIGCDTVCAVPLAAGDAIYLDDNGLYVDSPMPSFSYQGYSQPLTGKGVVVGCDEEGDDIEPNHSLTQLERRITWLGVQNIEPTIEVYSW